LKLLLEQYSSPVNQKAEEFDSRCSLLPY